MNLETVLHNHYEARGGLKAIHAIQSIHHVGTVTEKSGRVVAFKGWRKRPNLLRVAFSVGDVSGREGFDGTRAWEAYPWNTDEPVYVSGKAETSLKRGSEFDGHLIDYAEKGHHAEMLDTRKFDSTAIYAVQITLNDGNIKTYYLDAHTFLVIADESVRPVHAGEESRTINRYSDYRRVDGVLFPYQWVQTAQNGDHQETFEWETITANLSLAPDFFEMPGE